MKQGELRVVIASLGVAVLTLQGCGKYEDGPMFSLKSKDNRLVGEWYLSSSNIFVSNELTLEFESDGDFSQEQEISYFGYDAYEISVEGTWEWEDGKEAIILSYDDQDLYGTDRYEIKRLTSSELTITAQDGLSVVTYEFDKQ